MKSKKPTTKATGSTLVITKPESIIDRHLRPAIKPFAAELREAAALDCKLTVEVEKNHPNTAKLEAQRLLEATVAGDSRSDKILREAGGTEQFIRSKTALFDLAVGKHEGACQQSAALWGKVSAALEAAIDAASAEIQTQFDSAMLMLEELPGGQSLWEGKLRGLKSGLQRCERLAREMRHGADWQLKALGLERFITE
jgi:hypothetical protein